MGKIDFIHKFKDVCEKLNLKLNYLLEHSLKITNNSINIDRIGIIIKKNSISDDNLTHFINEFFIDNQEVNSFINDTKKKYGDKIHSVILGYSNGATEIYIEYSTLAEGSPIIVSYGLNNNEYSEYFSLINSNDAENEFIKFVKEKLPVSNTNKFYKGGWVKKGMKYLTIKEPSFKETLKNLCYIINPNEKNIIDKWFNEHKDKTINVIGYNIKNDEIILNIYGVKISFIFKLFRYMLRVQF
jgi:hypothetical protein